MGFELVLVRVMGKERRTLQVMAEPIDRARTMTIDDCAEISHAISAVLDVADPIAGAYALEVSTPGLDRPLVRPGDYERFAGEEARIETGLPVDGRKRFTGVLKGIEGEDVLLESGGEVVRLALPQIKKAKLVLTDALLKRHATAGGGARGAAMADGSEVG